MTAVLFFVLGLLLVVSVVAGAYAVWLLVRAWFGLPPFMGGRRRE
jgi:uncharacterized membrane protein